MSSESTASLISSESKKPQKDWQSVFATLSSHYGFSGKAPSVPQKPSKPRDSPSVSPSSKTCDAPTDSLPVRKTQPPKLEGYELAFGQLASSYGFGGGMISQPKKQ